MNLLTADVTQGLVGASFYTKSAGASMGIYRQAKASGDENVMKRALGYAKDSMSAAAKSSEDAGKALKEAQSEARAQAKIEQQAALQHQEAARKVESQQQTTSNSEPADTVEISKEGKVHAEAQSTMSTPDTVAVQTQSDKAVVTDTEIYTPQGGVQSATDEPKLTVTV